MDGEVFGICLVILRRQTAIEGLMELWYKIDSGRR
jgi:hypothetical protein